MLCKKTSLLSLHIATVGLCWKGTFGDPLLSNKDLSSGMARPAARCLFWVCEQIGQVCGWGLFVQPFLHWHLGQRRCLLAAVSQSVKTSFPPGAGADLKMVKCTAILRRINELKQGFILSDSFQKCLLPGEVRHICLKYLLGSFCCV